MAKLALVGGHEAASTSQSPQIGHGKPAVVVTDDRRRCVEANAVACRLLGMEREAIVGGRIDRLLTVAMREPLEHVWRAFRTTGGHAGPFDLANPGEVKRIEIAITENLIPGRHLIVLSPAVGEPSIAGADEAAASVGLNSAVRTQRGGRGPSNREREVLGLLATGATDPQIAEMLELSPATVQTHVRNAKSKLGARTRAQAVAMAIGDGLITV